MTRDGTWRGTGSHLLPLHDHQRGAGAADKWIAARSGRWPPPGGADRQASVLPIDVGSLDLGIWTLTSWHTNAPLFCAFMQVRGTIRNPKIERVAPAWGRTADLPLFREPSYHALTRRNAAPQVDLGAHRA
jgi:hypothetical protein